MPNIDESAREWQLRFSGAVGEAIAKTRELRGLSAVQLASATRDLGFPISRVAISKIENNKREGKMDISELVVLARALRVTPLELLYSPLPDGDVEMLPGTIVPAIKAAFWFGGETRPDSGLPEDQQFGEDYDYPIRVVRHYQDHKTWAGVNEQYAAKARKDGNQEREEMYLEAARRRHASAERWRRIMKSMNLTVKDQ